MARKKEREREKPRFASRTWFSALMHRHPCRWDVLIYELAGDLARASWQARPKIKRDSLRLPNDELVEYGRIFARAFEIMLQQRLSHDESLAAAMDAGALSPELVESLAAQAEHECFNPLLRKCAEDVRLEHVPSKDPDALLLSRTLAETLRKFLADRCGPDGDLRECMTGPLAEAGGFFPPKKEEEPLPPPAGRPSRDIPRLAVVVFEGDDPVTLKYKLGAIAHQDPWLAREFKRYVLENSRDLERQGHDPQTIMSIMIDECVFRSTRLWGKTPIDILLERQPGMPAIQRRRLERWRDENVQAMLIVKEVLHWPWLIVEDVIRQLEYRVLLPRRQMHNTARPGAVMQTRVVPWDEDWAVTGAATHWPPMAPAKLDELRRNARTPKSGVGPEWPLYAKAIELQEEEYRAWMELFGRDEMLFDDGKKLDEALARFYQYLTFERIRPETGKTIAAAYQEEHGQPPRLPEGRLPRHILQAGDVGVVFHPLHGMLFLVQYGLFRSAFASDAEPTKAQLDIVWDYLREDSISFYVFQRLRDLHPAQTERLFRRLLQEDSWQLDRDFDPTLRKYKGDEMRRPPKTWITPV